MSDNPFANVPMASPFDGVPMDQPVRPNFFQRNVPLALRDITRGIMSVPVDAARLAGFFGAEGAGRWGEGATNWLNRNVAPEATFANEPGRAALQFGAPALIPMTWAATPLRAAGAGAARAVLPTAVTNSPTAAAVGAGALRAAELALPGAAPYTLANVAANAGVGIGVGYGVERLTDEAERQRSLREQGGGRPLGTAEAAALGEGTPFDAVPVERSVAERVTDWLPYVVGGLGVLSVGAGARAAARMQRAANDANTGGLVQPGTPTSLAPTSAVGEQVEAGLFQQQQILFNRAEQAVRDGTMSRRDADDFVNTVITHSNESINSDVLREFWRTGNLPGGRHTEAPERMAFDIAQLSPDQRRLFNDLMAAADETDVRIDALRNGKFRTGHPGQAQRTSLWDKTDADLKRAIAAGRADPAVAQLETRYRTINNAILDYGQRQGIWSTDEVARMRASGPNYMHRLVAELRLERDTSGSGTPITQGTENNSPLTKRAREEYAGSIRAQDPVMAMEDGIRQTLDYIRRNESIKNAALNLGNRGMLGIGKVLPDRPGVRTADNMVPVKFRYNGDRYILELDPTISAGLLPYPRAFIPIINGARILEQKLTTGPLGTMLGNIQAPLSAFMGTFAAMANAPRNMRLGYVDKIVHHYTGGRVNLRAMGIADPTFIAQVIAAFIRDVSDHTADVLGRSLQRSITSGGMAARLVDILGAGRAQKMADAFTRHYTNSDLHRMRREGLHAQGLSYAAEGGGLTDFGARLSNLSQISPEYAASMPYGGFAKSVTDIKDMRTLREYMAVQSAGVGGVGIGKYARRAWNGYAKLLDMLANAPQSAMYRANKGNKDMTERAIIGVARSVTGDPSQYGGNRVAQGILSAVPFGNITVQAGHQAYRAMRREPVAWTMRVGSIGTMLSLTMLWSAINADEAAIAEGREPSAVAHMLTRDSRDAAAAFRFYLPGLTGEEGIRIPVEQSLAPFFSGILGMIQEGFNVTDPQFFTERFAPLRDSIHRFIEDGNSNRLRAAIGLAGADVSLPGILDAGARLLTGNTIENAASFATGPRINPVPDADGFERTLINNDVVDRYTATVLETALGFGGSALLDLLRTFGFAKRETGRTSDALGAVAEQYSLNLSGAARIAGPALWGQERRLRNTDAVGEQVREAEQKINEIRRNLAQVRADRGSIGGQRNLREAEFGGGRAGVPEDIRGVVMSFNRLGRVIDDLQEQRRRAQETLRSYNSSPQLRADPSRLRTLTNEQALEVRRINAEILSRINEVEADLSAETGRRIRLTDLDPLRGLDQFQPIQ